jgi:hypothetical protein
MTRPKPRKRSGPTHDPGYKHLYSHAAMVRDLLTGFIDADWVGKLDLGTLERCGSSYVSDDLRERADDILWRVRFDDAWLYLFLLLEFQSGIDRWMALRIATYIGLLYQDLINTKQLAADIPTIHDLHEVNIMLSRTEPWDVQYERIGFARGLAAERNLLARQVRRRFGDDIATRSAALLEPIAEQPLLEELGERLIDSPDPADWLAALQQAAQRAQQVGADPQPDE